jgi:hypothetical protein
MDTDNVAEERVWAWFADISTCIGLVQFAFNSNPKPQFLCCWYDSMALVVSEHPGLVNLANDKAGHLAKQLAFIFLVLGLGCCIKNRGRLYHTLVGS